MREWFVFSHKGKELFRMTVNGYVSGEVKSTMELLAHENNIPVDEITVTVEGGNGHEV